MSKTQLDAFSALAWASMGGPLLYWLRCVWFDVVDGVSLAVATNGATMAIMRTTKARFAPGLRDIYSHRIQRTRRHFPRWASVEDWAIEQTPHVQSVVTANLVQEIESMGPFDTIKDPSIKVNILLSNEENYGVFANPSYLLCAYKMVGDNAVLRTGGELSPIVIESSGNNGFVGLRAIIMPIDMREE